MITRVIPFDQAGIEEAQQILQQDGLVAFATDTVYGLGALAFSPAAIERLFQAKGRDQSKAIPILLAGPDQLSLVASQVGETVARLAEAFWPGAVTLVVPRHPGLPEVLSPGPTVGVRVPDHPQARAMLRRCGPLAATSANLSGGENPRSASDVLDQMAGRIELVLDGGDSPGGTPSTVVDCTRPEPLVLRPGPVTEEMIRRLLA
jgi:L-threonylcarbamoyladenylate synthase